MRHRVWKQCQKIGIDEYLGIGPKSSGLNAFRRHEFASSTDRAAVRLAG
jgi:hypothetical protein